MNRIIVLLAVAWAGIPAGAQKVRVDFDHTCKFSGYQTYRWAPSPDSQSINQLMQERAAGFIEEALSARRLRRVNTAGDLLVSYQTTTTELPQYTTFTNGTGPGWGWGWGWNDSVSVTTVQPILLETIVVDIRDARSQRLVFQGVATSTLSSRPPKNTKRLANAVRKIFEKYPPC
jgi:hypothetical protein